jgi:hypothetical protein
MQLPLQHSEFWLHAALSGRHIAASEETPASGGGGQPRITH